MKCIFPCVFIPEEVGGYSVLFPDIGGGTQGETLSEALDMAEDLVKCVIEDALEEGEEIPTQTPPEKVEVPAGAFMTLIRVDTDAYKNA